MDGILGGNLSNTGTRGGFFDDGKQALTVKERIGFVPTSVWVPDWRLVKRLKDLVGDRAQSRQLKTSGLKNLPKTKTKGKLVNNENYVSIFNPHLAMMILSAYCPPKARIYDPFAGGGTRGFIAAAMGHRYYGREIRMEEVQRIKAQQKKLGLPFAISCNDARKPVTVKHKFDFSYTCPPYYNLEVYSDMPADLSAMGTYDDFLTGIHQTLASTFPAMKAGSLTAWVVGNFRIGDELKHFNGDLISLARGIGYKLHDEIVWQGASSLAKLRAGNFEKARKSVRIHEYIVLLRKPFGKD